MCTRMVCSSIMPSLKSSLNGQKSSSMNIPVIQSMVCFSFWPGHRFGTAVWKFVAGCEFWSQWNPRVWTSGSAGVPWGFPSRWWLGTFQPCFVEANDMTTLRFPEVIALTCTDQSTGHDWCVIFWWQVKSTEDACAQLAQLELRQHVWSPVGSWSIKIHSGWDNMEIVWLRRGQR